MKKIVLLLIVVVFSVANNKVQAQVQIALGIKGGPNFAKTDISTITTSARNTAGYHLGILALIKLSKIGIQPEILFSSQGYKIKESLSGIGAGSVDLKSTFNYINIPILLKLYLAGGLNLQVGPQFGLMTDASSEIIPAGGIKTVTNVKDQFKKYDISAAIGLGWDLPFGLMIDGRYNLGLSDINDNGSSESIKNQVIQVSVGYKLIKLGK